ARSLPPGYKSSNRVQRSPPSTVLDDARSSTGKPCVSGLVAFLSGCRRGGHRWLGLPTTGGPRGRRRGTTMHAGSLVEHDRLIGVDRFADVEMDVLGVYAGALEPGLFEQDI